jgi:uncharacterized membrane protein YtjA (UPF0391 family)
MLDLNLIFAVRIQVLKINKTNFENAMFKWTATFFVISMMAAVIGYTTDIEPKTATMIRYIFFAGVGLTLISAIIGATLKRHKTD